MDVAELTKTIIATLEELQKQSGRACGKLTGDTTPVGSLEGFDSLAAIEATVAVEVALSKEFPTDNIFVVDHGGRKKAITITEAAKRVLDFERTKAA